MNTDGLASFTPRADADGMQLVVRDRKPPSWWKVAWSALKGAAGMVGLGFVLALPEDLDDSAVFWRALSGHVPSLAFLGAMVLGMAGLGAYNGAKERRARLERISTSVHLGAHALTIADQRYPWHSLRAVEHEGDDLLLHCIDGSSTRLHAGGHGIGPVDSLLEVLRQQIEQAQPTAEEVESLHRAAAALAQRVRS